MHHKFKQYPNSLRKHRKNVGLRQFEVARLLGLKTPERLSRWENGTNKPMPKTVFLLAQIYHVPPQDLFSEIWQANGRPSSTLVNSRIPSQGAKKLFKTRQFGVIAINVTEYSQNRNVAVELVDGNGESVAVLSVNLPDSSQLLGPNEFFAKTWSENEELAQDALASGIFQNTGKTGGGVLNAQIWIFRSN